LRAGRSRLGLESSCIALGHGATILAGLVSVRLYTELVPRDVFGGANLLIGIMVLFTQGLVAPVTQTQVRYQADYTGRGLGQYYASLILRYALLASAVAAAPVLIACLLWPELRAGAGLAVVPLLFAWIVATSIKSVVVGRLNAERRQMEYSRFIGAEALSILVVTAIALSLSATIEAFIAGQFAGTVLALVLFGAGSRELLNLSRDEHDIARDVQQQIWRYGLPFAPIILLEWFANQTDRYVLASHVELSAVGIYAAAFAIASKPSMIAGGALTDLLRPVLFSTYAEARASAENYYRIWLVLQVICSVFVVFIFFSFGDLIAEILLADTYRDGAPQLMVWISAAYGIRALAMVLENRFYAIEQPQCIAMIKGIAVIVGVSAALLLIPTVGLVGAAMANFATQLIYIVACAIVLRFSFAGAKNGSTSA